MSRTVLILQHGDWGPAAILAEWCAGAEQLAISEAKAAAFELFDAFWERAR